MSLTIKAAALARIAPQQWREFLAELAAYSDKKRTELVQAPVETIQVAQGRAQACALLCDLFGSAVKDADRVADLLQRRGK